MRLGSGERRRWVEFEEEEVGRTRRWRGKGRRRRGLRFDRCCCSSLVVAARKAEGIGKTKKRRNSTRQEGGKFQLLERRLPERRRTVSFVPENERREGRRRRISPDESGCRREKERKTEEIYDSLFHPTPKQLLEEGKVSAETSKEEEGLLKRTTTSFLLLPLLPTSSKDQDRKDPRKGSDPRGWSKPSVEGFLLRPSFPISSSHSTNHSMILHQPLVPSPIPHPGTSSWPSPPLLKGKQL